MIGPMDPTTSLQVALAGQCDRLVAKLDGLGEYDVRRPLTPTGTNLLGLVKHVASIQLGYLGDCFGRPSGIPLPWYDEATADPDLDGDLWVTAQEPRAEILDLMRASSAHAAATLAELPLDTVGEVPWWPEVRRYPTLHHVALHLVLDVAGHAGHADILRELLDGAVGYRPGTTNLPDRDADAWGAFSARIEAAAREAAGMPPA
jgi:hypothetical protein